MTLKQETIAKIQEELQGLSEEEQQKKFQEIVKKLPPDEIKEFQKQQCPFCSIASGNIKAHVVFEDNVFIAVLDINPANKGHVILFPKEHRYALFDMTDNEIAEMFKLANKLNNAAHDAVNSDGTNVLVAVGEAAGQRIGHLIVHIIPRFKNDGLDFSWDLKKISEAELEKIAELLKSKLKVEKKEEVKIKKIIPRKERERIA